MRELGGEFGTVTGRERRCGWLDLVALRYAVRLNGITSIALTKLDVLVGVRPSCRSARAYELRDGTRTDEFPAHQSDFHAARPVYEVLAGWGEPLDGDELPDAARRYVEFVEHELDVEVSWVGTGAEREQRARQRLIALLPQTTPAAYQAEAVRVKGPSGDPTRRWSAALTAAACCSSSDTACAPTGPAAPRKDVQSSSKSW